MDDGLISLANGAGKAQQARNGAVILFAVTAATGCPGDDVAVDGGTPGSDTGVFTSGTTGGDDTADDDGTGEPPPEPLVGPCETLDVGEIQGGYSPSTPQTRVFKSDWVCPEIFPFLSPPFEQPTISVHVTYPDPMPTDVALPVVAFVPGANQHAHLYEHVHDELASLGAIVLSVAAPLTASVQTRAHYLACATRWLRWENAPSEDPNNEGRPAAIGADNIACEGLTLGGHSRGGQAAYLLANTRDEAPYSDLLESYELAALFGIAPLFEISGPSGGYTALDSATAPHLLVLATTHDEDATGDGTSRFDVFMPEYQVSGQTLFSSQPARYLIETRNIGHNSFGGVAVSQPQPGQLGYELPRAYVAAFFEHHVLERNRDEAHALLMGERYPEALLDMDPNPWSFNPIYSDGHLWGGSDCGTMSAGDCQASLVCDFQAGNCIPTGCEPLSPQDCIQTRGCVLRDDDACVGQPLVFATALLDTRDLGGTRQVIRDFDLLGPIATDPTDFDAAVGEASALLPSWAHQTSLMRIDWADASPSVPDGNVSLSMPNGAEDWTIFDHLSLRAGQVAVLSGSGLERETPNSFGLVVIDVQGRELPLDPGPLVAREVFSGGPCTNCYYQTMHTIRFPTPEICVPPFEADAVQRIELRFEDDEDISRAIVDTVELTAIPFDHDEENACGTMSGAFLCPVSSSFEALEVSCEVEPTPTCPSPSIVHTPVDVPVVNLQTHAVEGWVVHVPAGFPDLEELTQAQEDIVWAKCVEACELEWLGEPVTASCDGVGAFDPLVLLHSPSVGPWAVIPPEFAEGDGVIMGVSPGCALQAHGGCCAVFDENLCAAAPLRPTVAPYPLDRGERFRLSLGGSSTKVTLESPGGSVSRAMVGEVGWGPRNGVTYLGSLRLETVSPVTLEDTCPDETKFAATVSLEAELVQPAFGVGQVVGTNRGFPPGALRLRMKIRDEDTSQTHEILGVNKNAVVGSAGGHTTFSFQGMEVEFLMPCGTAFMPVTARFDVQRNATLGRPPSASITIPDEVPCTGRPTDLTANVSDADNDVASVRWFIGDVLMEESVTRVAFTQTQEVKLRVRDERGATEVRTKTVTCE